jgi:hypothetical protein
VISDYHNTNHTSECPKYPSQLGLGATVNVPAVSVPAEVNLSRNYAGSSSVKCTDIAAGQRVALRSLFSHPHILSLPPGGNVAYFTIESVGTSREVPFLDVFACGMGQYGALGNGTYVQAQGTPVRMKVLSGNLMCMQPAFLFLIRTLKPHLSQLMSRPIGQRPFGPRHLVFHPQDTHLRLSRAAGTY